MRVEWELAANFDRGLMIDEPQCQLRNMRGQSKAVRAVRGNVNLAQATLFGAKNRHIITPKLMEVKRDQPIP